MSRICCTSWFSAEASWNCWSAAARSSSASSRWSTMVAAARSVCTWIPYLAVGHMCPSVRRCLSRRVTSGDEHEPKGSNVQLGEGRNRHSECTDPSHCRTFVTQMYVPVTHSREADVFGGPQRVPFSLCSSESSVGGNLASGGYVGVAPGFA